MGKELSEMTLEELWELFPIILKEHNKDYKNWYEIEKQRLLSYIDEQDIIRISHVGSTAVEGLIAKPTVDILLEIDNESNIERYEHDRDGYTDAKSDFILKYAQKAKKEYANKYKPRKRMR